MRIILDSTAYRADFLLRGNAFRILLPALGRLGAKLLLPQVVLEEVVNGFQERLEDCLKKAAALREEVRRVGLEGSFALQPPEISREVAKFRSYLINTLNAELMHIPAISHHEDLKIALDLQNPFNDPVARYP